MIHLWHQYILLVKRGNSPLTSCPTYMYDVAECELLAEAEISRKKREKEEIQNILKGIKENK